MLRRLTFPAALSAPPLSSSSTSAHQLMMMKNKFQSCFFASSSPLVLFSAQRFTSGTFSDRHIGPTPTELRTMLASIQQFHAALEKPDSPRVRDKPFEEHFVDPLAFASYAIPRQIDRPAPLPEHAAESEAECLARTRTTMAKNKSHIKSLIGQGFYQAVVPPVIQRNVLENQGWYTPYTPYQAEISQGRLEALFNYQTVVTELTGMDTANASLLDQATGCAEALMLSFNHHRKKRTKFFVSNNLFKSCLELVKVRAAPFGVDIVVGDPANVVFGKPQPQQQEEEQNSSSSSSSSDDGNKNKNAIYIDDTFCGVMVQSPDTFGVLRDYSSFFQQARAAGILCCIGTDLLACTVTKPPGEMGADVVISTGQRLGLPLGYGGPHPGVFATRSAFRRLLPGRIVGISKDNANKPSFRIALQTREQHIKREHATSNICTAQALVANMAGFYAQYHGADGLTEIARRCHRLAKIFAAGLEAVGVALVSQNFFDTVTFRMSSPKASADFVSKCVKRGINVWAHDSEVISVSMDEATKESHVLTLLEVAGLVSPQIATLEKMSEAKDRIGQGLERREGSFMNQKIFKNYKSETAMMRYLYELQLKDFGLANGMISLGSCTMKLNPAATMLPLSWPEVADIHPFVPVSQAEGYRLMIVQLEQRLREISGLDACSLQPNSGAQGEYTGLRVIKEYLTSKKDKDAPERNVCFIPANAHGTNPASAVLAGMKVVTVKCHDDGSIDFDVLKALCEKHGKTVAAIMITYPSTYGIFDNNIKEITKLVHEVGGQVYIDGANFNAMVGLTGPGFVGGDVCHFNLHKTFSIPHGGGGPGMGPICVKEHLAPFLPSTTLLLANGGGGDAASSTTSSAAGAASGEASPSAAAASSSSTAASASTSSSSSASSAGAASTGGKKSFGIVSQAPYGSASVSNISNMLMSMLGSEGLRRSTCVAVTSANYLAARLAPHYRILYRGPNNCVSHEFILDLRKYKKTADVTAEDVAKRLMDYGFHAPTLSFPVDGTLLIEPTESEPKEEMDRFVEALVRIRAEIKEIEEGKADKANNVLTNAPHTQLLCTSDKWDLPYSRERAAFPVPWLREKKFWPAVGRIEGAWGDLNLVCCAAPVSSY